MNNYLEGFEKYVDTNTSTMHF